MTQNLYGGKPIYESEDGRIARYDANVGKWEFADTTFNLGLLIENSPSFWNYPLDGRDWTYAESVTYADVDVLCGKKRVFLENFGVCLFSSFSRSYRSSSQM